MRLLDVTTGKVVRVVGFDGGRGLAQKIRQMGLMPGVWARVIRQAPFGGPLLLEIQGRVIAIGRNVAARIEVEEGECDLH